MISRSRALAAALVLCCVLALTACGTKTAETTGTTGQDQATGATGSSGSTAQDATQNGTQEGGLYTPAYQPNGKEVAVIKTDKGDIKVELYGKEAPIHVGNFVELARKGFYNDTKFHRFIEGFVVQGGDPDTKNATKEEVAAEAAKGDGYGKFGVGGPGYTIKGEFDPATNPHKHVKGALGMARSQSPDSAGSQFYFALQPLTQLDGSYTVFGQVVGGMDVMEKLRAGDAIKSIEILNAAQ